MVETNTIGMSLVLIPPGTFVSGRSQSLTELAEAFPMIQMNAQNASFKRGLVSEQPQHKVRITKPFCIGKYNVTRAQFQQFVENTAYRTEAEVDGKGGGGYTEGENPPLAKKPSFNWRNTGFPQEDDSPVVNVSWNDAILFCRWLSKKEGKTYRLPSDAEWEFACRAGTTTRFAMGNRPDDLVNVANIADLAYFAMLDGGTSSAEATERRRVMGMMLNGNDHYAFTSPVGRFKPNAFGLYDMQGNAATWCGDWFEADYYAHSPLDDPQGPRSGNVRLVRGGSWQFIPVYCRSAARFAYPPSSHESFLGFRVVCELGEN